MKKKLCVFLSLLLLMTIPVTPAYTDSQREQDIAQRIQYMVDHCFDNSMYFSVHGNRVPRGKGHDYYSKYCIKFNGASSCGAFAAYAYYYLFKKKPTHQAQEKWLYNAQIENGKELQNFMKGCQPGDVLHYFREDAEHWAMVWKVDRNNGNLTLYESNVRENINGQIYQARVRTNRILSGNELRGYSAIVRYRPSGYPLWDWSDKMPSLSVHSTEVQGQKVKVNLKINNPYAYPVIWTGYYKADDLSALQKAKKNIRDEGEADRHILSEKKERMVSISVPLPQEEGYYMQLFASSGKEEVRSEIYAVDKTGVVTQCVSMPSLANWTDEMIRDFADNKMKPDRVVVQDGLSFSIKDGVARYNGVEDYQTMDDSIRKHIKNRSFYIPNFVEIAETSPKAVKGKVRYPVIAIGDLINSMWVDAASGGMCDAFMDFDQVIVPEGAVAIGKDIMYVYGGSGLMKDLRLPSTLRFLAPGFGACMGKAKLSLPWNNKYFSLRDGLLIDNTTKTLLAYVGGNRNQVTVPGDVKRIASYAFNYASIEELVFQEGVSSLSSAAVFSPKGLLRITLPASVNEISDQAFLACDNLTLTMPGSFEGRADDICPGYNVTYLYLGKEVDFTPRNKPDQLSDDEILQFAITDKLEGAERVEENGIKYTIWRGNARIDSGSPYDGIFPDTVQDYPVVAVGNNAFFCEARKRLVIPEGVVAIGNDVFSVGMSLERDYAAQAVHLPSTLRMCGNMTNLFMPTTTVEQGNPVFFVEGNHLVNRRTGEKWSIWHYNEETNDWE